MEAPVIGPPTKAHSATIAPIAIPAIMPVALVSVATAVITNIRKKLRITSHAKAITGVAVGMVAPKVLPSGRRTDSNVTAIMAPKNCASQ